MLEITVIDLMAHQRSFGESNEFIKTLHQDYNPTLLNGGESSSMLEEVKILASCSYENQTIWGTKVSTSAFYFRIIVTQEYYTYN